MDWSDICRSINSLDSYLRQANQAPYLSVDRERRLFGRLREGDRGAMGELVASHLRLVVAIARPFSGQGLPFADLVQEGNVGLLHAVLRFDHRTGNRLSTYATPYIRGSIQRALANTGRVIRVPVAAQGKLARARRAERLSPAASAAEIAEEAGLSRRELDLLERDTMPPAPLDAPPAQAMDLRRSRHPADDLALSAEEQLIVAERRASARCALAKLHGREREVIERRYGLGGSAPQSLDAIGRELGLSRERVRQIEVVALAKLARLLDGFNPAT